jgi:hypothetical protein
MQIVRFRADPEAEFKVNQQISLTVVGNQVVATPSKACVIGTVEAVELPYILVKVP